MGRKRCAASQYCTGWLTGWAGAAAVVFISMGFSNKCICISSCICISGPSPRRPACSVPANSKRLRLDRDHDHDMYSSRPAGPLRYLL